MSLLLLELSRDLNKVCIYSLYVQYNVIILLGHNITDNDVNTQQNEAYDVIGQFKMKIVHNVSYEDVIVPANNTPDYVNVRNVNKKVERFNLLNQ